MVARGEQSNGDEDRQPIVREERAVGARPEHRYSEPDSINRRLTKWTAR